MGSTSLKVGQQRVFHERYLLDCNVVKEKPPVNKSMLAAKALQNPITRVADGPHWIRVLAAELSLRLNDARKARPSLWPKTLVLNAGNGRVRVWSHLFSQEYCV